MEPLRHINRNKSFLEEISNIEPELIARYLSGEANIDEMNEVLSWIKKTKDNQVLFSSMKRAWIESKVVLINQDEKTEGAWVRLKFRTSSSQVENNIQDSQNNVFLFYRIAGIILLLITFSFVFYYLAPFKSKSANKLTYNEIVVPYGAKSIVTLPDGTKLWINSGTKIRYANNFGETSREIFMEGEAYFDVVKNPKKPFLVRTGYINIKVLGTAFNVKSYPDENRIETTLDRGLIEITKENGNEGIVTVKPKEKITCLKFSKQLAIADKKVNTAENRDDHVPEKTHSNNAQPEFQIYRHVNTELITSWKEGKLVFERERLEDIFKKLERRYDVVFSFDKSELKNYRFSGSLPELTLQQVLEGIQLSAPILYTINKREVVISENPLYKDFYKKWIK
jgi:transmembrane sensor